MATSSDIATNANSIPTKQALLTAIDDIEIVALELFDLLANQGKSSSKATAVEQTSALIQLLVAKDAEIQELLKVAKNQASVQETVNRLQREVDKQQEDIKKLQTHLKEAESLLSNAVYQAKQKLDHIRKANRNPVSSEELIKYAHKISASNSVSCPPGWTPGDQRRPYPSEMEMRMGWLGKMSDPAWNSNFALGHMSQMGSSGANMPQGHHTGNTPGGHVGMEHGVMGGPSGMHGPGQGMGDSHGARQGMWGGPGGQGMHHPHGQVPHSSPVKGPHRSPGSASGSGTIHYVPPTGQNHPPHSGAPDVMMPGGSQHAFPGGQTPLGRPSSGPGGSLSESSMHHYPHPGQGPLPPGSHPHHSGPGMPSQKEVDDVEVMSTDSSSSSSSDSQ